MLLVVGNMTGFSKTIIDLSENSKKVTVILEDNKTSVDVFAITFKMVPLDCRVIDNKKSSLVKYFKKNELKFYSEKKLNLDFAAKINYKARDKLRC